MGVAWGRLQDYGLAVAHPVIVLGALVAIAWAADAMHPAPAGSTHAVRDFAVMAGATIPAAILTEEGFFRGWLVASLRRLGLGAGAVLAASSVAFALWHVSAISLHTGFDLPAAQIPVYLLNAAVIGAIWCVMRTRSESIVVSSVSHGLWNGGAYVLFGYGQKVGALGIADTAFFGPENGLLGLALNLVFLAAVVRWLLSRR
jgi:membrane protease YdiL (CAAX protease family)